MDAGVDMEGGCMKIFYKKDEHVIIKFDSKELAQALGVLKALAIHFKAMFIFDVCKDLEADLFPKPKLPMAMYHHICTKCFCEIDIRTTPFIHQIGEKEDTWIHQTCPELKNGYRKEH